jgi:hypothetical protein
MGDKKMKDVEGTEVLNACFEQYTQIKDRTKHAIKQYLTYLKNLK